MTRDIGERRTFEDEIAGFGTRVVTSDAVLLRDSSNGRHLRARIADTDRKKETC